MNEISAREMFEELGYKRSTDIDAIAYSKKLDGIFHRFEITFDVLEKEIVIDDGYEAYIIDYALLKAINQQCKELGWIAEASKNETNFEHYFEKIKELVSLYHCNPQAIANGLMAVADEDILGAGLIATNAILDWCKKPYKNRDYCLSEFEYELLESYTNDDEEVTSLCIKDIKVLQNMQKKGYFRNVDNYTPIRDILKCSEIKKGEKR